MLKLKKSSNKEVVQEFIKKDDSIEYTQEDVDFYNEYFKDDNLRDFTTFLGCLVMLGLFMVVFPVAMLITYMFTLESDLFKTINFMGFYGVIGIFLITLGFVYDCKGFKNALIALKKFLRLKKLKDTKLNNHYYLKNRVEVKLSDEDVIMDESILNKVIKKYPKNILLKDLFKSESSKKDIINEYKVLSKYAND